MKRMAFGALLLLLLCGISHPADAQQSKIDSLQKSISAEKNDSIKANALIVLAGVFEMRNLDTALLVIDEAIELSTVKKLPTIQAKAMSWKGYVLNKKGDIPQALEYNHKGLKLHEKLKDRKGMAADFNNLGMIYYAMNDLPKCLDYFNKGLIIWEELNRDHPGSAEYKKGMSYTLNNIGAIYKLSKDFDKSLSSFEKNLKVQTELNDVKGLGTTFNNMGALYKLMGEAAKDPQEATRLYNLAISFFQQSLEKRKELNDKGGISSTYDNLGRTYHQLKKYKEAEDYSLKSLSLAEELGYPERIKNASENLYLFYKDRDNGTKALKHYELYITMRDSINSDKNEKEALKTKMQYEYEKKEAVQQAEQDKKDMLAKEDLEQQKMQRNGLIGGFALTLALAGISFRSFRIKSKANKIISLQKQQVEEQNRLVEEKQKEILDSINYAKRIQLAILPPQRLVAQLLPESFILYKPKDIVAGDFYWLEHKNDIILFAAADCTGHGVPGAMVSVICNNGLNRSVREHGITEPGRILDKTREIVIAEFEKSDEEMKDGMDISLCTLKGHTLQWAGANNPLWIIRGNDLIEMKADKQPIGKHTDNAAFTTHTVALQKGDLVYVFTDGFQDQFGGEQGKKFKTSNFKRLLLSVRERSMAEQKAVLDEEFRLWQGSHEQVDDVCVWGVRIG